MNVISTRGPVVFRWVPGAMGGQGDQGSRFDGMIARIRRWNAVRRTRKSLSELDDNALADLGLYRDQIGLVAQRGRLPGWDEM